MIPGARLGSYEILSALGAGGMGEVYRARDTKLNRDVAIKVLLPAVANDPDRLARFSREAQVLASLNHPNIAHIHGLEESNGVTALVMELVEGEDLAARLHRGAIPIDEALPIARQIAEALEAAHDHGIIHRDLKPANIKVRPDGTVKVLDFGLAKAVDPTAGSSATAMNSPTLSIHATEAGIILGTAAYMSPEQARGKAVDKRTDIWALGCVLFEMLTGKRAFPGDDATDTIVAVISEDPDWSALPAKTPIAIRRLLSRALDKDPRQRLDSAAAARLEIDEARLSPGAAGTAPIGRSPNWLPWSIAALSIVAVAVLAFSLFGRSVPVSLKVAFEIPPPGKAILGNALGVSPDGRHIAFIAQQQLWIRALDSSQPKPLAGTDGAMTALVWSPDSRFLLFASLGLVKKIALSGGSAQTLCACPNVRGGAWRRDGVILLSGPGAIMRISDTGGTPTPVVSVSSPARGNLYFLRDGDHFLYASTRGIYLGSLAAPSPSPSQPGPQPLVAYDVGMFVYVSSEDQPEGHILFQRDGTLMAQPFDGVKLALAGPAFAIAENVGAFGASPTGVLAYRANQANLGSQLSWYGRDGKALGRVGPAANHGNLQLSFDGKTVMVDRSDSNTGQHMWAGDLARGVFSRPNPLDSQETGPCALPDGRVAFTYSSPGIPGDIYVSAGNGAGALEAWVKSENVKHVDQCAPDGRFLIYDEHNGSQGQDLWILPVNPPASGSRKPIPFLVTSADETFGQFSPDGKWVAYSSDETGRREVYVRDFAPERVPAAGDGKWLISTNGGDKPRWRRDGRELYYIALDQKMMAVPVTSTPAFEPGIPVALFDVETTGFVPYDVSPDGRFLINTPNSMSASPITVILNWQAALRNP